MVGFVSVWMLRAERTGGVLGTCYQGRDYQDGVRDVEKLIFAASDVAICCQKNQNHRDARYVGADGP